MIRFFSGFSIVFLFTFDIYNFILWYFLFQSWSDINTQMFQCSTSLSNDMLCIFVYLPSLKAELKEGGKDIEVTFENREEYVRRPGMDEWCHQMLFLVTLKRWIGRVHLHWGINKSKHVKFIFWNVPTSGIDFTFNITQQVYLSKGHLDQSAGSFIYWLNPFPFQVPIEHRYCDYIFNTSVERQRLNIPQLITLFGDKFCKSTWPQKVVYFAFASSDPFLVMFPNFCRWWLYYGCLLILVSCQFWVVLFSYQLFRLALRAIDVWHVHPGYWKLTTADDLRSVQCLQKGLWSMHQRHSL